jgi:hypothetical protein
MVAMVDVPPTGSAGISVIIPCLNEQDSIAQVIRAAGAGMAKTGLPGEVIVVDNGCTDRTVEIARAEGARVVVETSRGYGSALRSGFAAASYDLLAMGDGDLTYDFTRLDELVRPIQDGEADFVIGNRMRNLQPGSMPWLHRYVGNPLLSMLLRLMFLNRAVRDAHCGMRVIRRDAYRALRCVTTGMEFASEMVVRAIHNKLRIAERDIEYHPRRGESKLRSFQDGWRHLRFMMLHSPTTLLLIPGGFFWAVGLVMALLLARGPIIVQGRHIDIHCMIMAGLLNIASIQVITIGLLAKAYAHLSGLRFDPVVAWFYRWFTFEKAFLLAIPLVLIGAGLSLAVAWEWWRHGFGNLNQARPLFFALLCLVNGVQAACAAYLFSIMALPRHFDEVPPHARDILR